MSIISSPLKRAAQTASLVGNEMGYEGKIASWKMALRPGAGLCRFPQAAGEVCASIESIMVVGHNPKPERISRTLHQRNRL